MPEAPGCVPATIRKLLRLTAAATLLIGSNPGAALEPFDAPVHWELGAQAHRQLAAQARSHGDLLLVYNRAQIDPKVEAALRGPEMARLQHALRMVRIDPSHGPAAKRRAKILGAPGVYLELPGYGQMGGNLHQRIREPSPARIAEAGAQLYQRYASEMRQRGEGHRARRATARADWLLVAFSRRSQSR